MRFCIFAAAFLLWLEPVGHLLPEVIVTVSAGGAVTEARTTGEFAGTPTGGR